MQSSDDVYLIDETRRKPTTETGCPTLFDKEDGRYSANLKYYVFLQVITATISFFVFMLVEIPN